MVLAGCSDDDDEELAVVLFQDVRGIYRGVANETDSGCTNPASNGSFTCNVTANIVTQNGADFSGTLLLTGGSANLSGRLMARGATDGTFTLAAGGVTTQSTFSGTLTGNMLSVTYTGRATAGETCTFQGQFTATRP